MSIMTYANAKVNRRFAEGLDVDQIDTPADDYELNPPRPEEDVEIEVERDVNEYDPPDDVTDYELRPTERGELFTHHLHVAAVSARHAPRYPLAGVRALDCLTTLLYARDYSPEAVKYALQHAIEFGHFVADPEDDPAGEAPLNNADVDDANAVLEQVEPDRWSEYRCERLDPAAGDPQSWPTTTDGYRYVAAADADPDADRNPLANWVRAQARTYRSLGSEAAKLVADELTHLADGIAFTGAKTPRVYLERREVLDTLGSTCPTCGALC